MLPFAQKLNDFEQLHKNYTDKLLLSVSCDKYVHFSDKSFPCYLILVNTISILITDSSLALHMNADGHTACPIS